MENDYKYIYINVWRDLYLSSVNIASPLSMGLNFSSCHLKKIRAFFLTVLNLDMQDANSISLSMIKPSLVRGSYQSISSSPSPAASSSISTGGSVTSELSLCAVATFLRHP